MRVGGLIAPGLAAAVAVGAVALVGSSDLEHRRLVAEERAAFPAPGTRVAVGHGEAPKAPGLHLRVHAEGAGEPTLVSWRATAPARPASTCCRCSSACRPTPGSR